ncbi:sulfonate ABC transporter permease [Sporomusaceae bacterium FL31]|nr:sulfonate ABC transporter permease [Sporomusaceae bacterium FL31]GCE33551.1 sulfonate ABC transporter permease [Sporomusaceae bacterium]
MIKGKKYIVWAGKILTLGIFCGLWQFAAGFYSPEQLPGPLQVLKGIIELADTGILWEHIQVSLLRFSISYILAVLITVPLGLLLGWHTISWQALNPLIQILRPISPIAWFPLAVLWFGIGNAPAIFIIFLSAFFPILLATVSAVRSVDGLYLRVSKNFGVNRWSLFTKVVIPASFPQIMVGLHIAVGTAWIHLVAGEMLGAQSGLGYLIVDSRNFLRTDWIIGGMLIVGLLGLAIHFLIGWVEQTINQRWGME